MAAATHAQKDGSSTPGFVTFGITDSLRLFVNLDYLTPDGADAPAVACDYVGAARGATP
jgi:hypothetical protein